MSEIKVGDTIRCTCGFGTCRWNGIVKSVDGDSFVLDNGIVVCRSNAELVKSCESSSADAPSKFIDFTVTDYVAVLEQVK